MKPPPFGYSAPTSLDEALALLQEHGEDARPLAGGQSLVPLLSLRLARPSHLVDLAGISELATIVVEDGHLVIGAMTRERQAERHDDVHRLAPLLALALPLIGHPAIRSRGTIGGSLAHADPAAELPAVARLLDAELVAQSLGQGIRIIDAADFFAGFFTTALRPDEILTAVRIRPPEPGTGSAIEEVARRHGDFAMVGAAAMIRLTDGKIAEARVVLTGVSDVPVRATEAETILGGAEPTREAFAAAAEDAAEALSPPADLHGSSAYRRHLAVVLMKRTLALATQRGEGGGVNTFDIELTVNGTLRQGAVEPRRTLADFLREDLGLTGTHLGCEHGVCGACTVLVNGEPARSCLMLAVQARGADILTIEGLANDGMMNPLQQAMWESHGFQCGFCTPGFLMQITALLAENPDPAEAEIREALSGNLCRCTGYESIVNGVLRAAGHDSSLSGPRH